MKTKTNFLKIIQRVFDKLKVGVTVQNDPYSLKQNYSIRMLEANYEPYLKEILINEISKEFEGEINELENLFEQKRLNDEENKIEKIRFNNEKEQHKLEVDLLKQKLTFDIVNTTDEEKKESMKNALENVELRGRVKYLEKELEWCRKTMDVNNTSIAEALKSAFNQKIVIENK